MSIIEYYNKIFNKFTDKEKQIWLEHEDKLKKNRDFYTLFEIIIMVEGDNFGKYSDELIYIVKDPVFRYAIINKLVQTGKGNYMHLMIDRFNNWCPSTYHMT
jgi:hypothetical protein